MVAAFDGWNDACQSATNVIRHLVSKYRSLEVGHISRDGYYECPASGKYACLKRSTIAVIHQRLIFTIPSQRKGYSCRHVRA